MSPCFRLYLQSCALVVMCSYPGGEIRGQLSPSIPDYTTYPGEAFLSSAQYPAGTVVSSSAWGSAKVAYSPSTGTALISVQLVGITPTAMHIHFGALGADGPVLVTLPTGSFLNGEFAIPASAATAFLNLCQTYMNVHSVAYPSGELRGQIVFPSMGGFAFLTGYQQPTQVTSAASGTGMVLLTNATTVTVSLTLTGIVGQTAADLRLGAPGASGVAICTLPTGSFVNSPCTLTTAQMTSLKQGGVYCE